MKSPYKGPVLLHDKEKVRVTLFLKRFQHLSVKYFIVEVNLKGGARVFIQ